MKLIHWAIIFIVLIIPFSIIAREAITKKTLLLQEETRINNSIDNATYDAVSQILEVSQELGLGKNIPITYDVAMASINRFFQSLAVNFNLPNTLEASKSYFGQYVPAILIVGYDGLYVYSYELTPSGYQYVLKPKIPYAYKDSTGIMINFTLGNDVTLYRSNGFGSNSVKTIKGVVSDDLDEPQYNDIDVALLSNFCNNVSYILNRVGASSVGTLPTYLYTSTNGIPITQDYVYEYDSNGNATLVKEASEFHKLRRETIVNLIIDVLQAEINEHNTYADIIGVNYDFMIPEISKDQWNNTIDDISVLAFFQGMPIGASSYKNLDSYYNSYSLGGARIVNAKLFYGTSDKKYHRWYCEKINTNASRKAGEPVYDMYENRFITQEDAIRSGYYACEKCR